MLRKLLTAEWGNSMMGGIEQLNMTGLNIIKKIEKKPWKRGKMVQGWELELPWRLSGCLRSFHLQSKKVVVIWHCLTFAVWNVMSYSFVSSFVCSFIRSFVVYCMASEITKRQVCQEGDCCEGPCWGSRHLRSQNSTMVAIIIMIIRAITVMSAGKI